MKQGVFLLLFLSGFTISAPKTYAQNKEVNELKDSLEHTTSESLNRIDKEGQRQGWWYVDTKADKYNDQTIVFGRYLNNKKEGLWYKIDKLGKLISIEHFMEGALNGTSQYYEDGNLICIGNYMGLYSKYDLDSFWIANPLTGYDTMIIVPTEKGSVKHGSWRFYNKISGQLMSEEMYQVDHLLYKKELKPDTKRDSLLYRQMPQHRPIDKKRQTHRIPDRAKQKIGY